MTRDPVVERVVAGSEQGQRCDAVVARWLDEPRSQTQQRFAAGEVLVDGAPAAKSQRLAAGQVVRVLSPAPGASAGAPPRIPIRYVDEHLLVVAKPSGLVVHPGAGVGGAAGGGEPTLVDALLAMGFDLSQAGDPERPGIVHRLDRGTSGLLVVTRSDQAYRGMVALLAARDVRREYTVLVEGVPEPARATIDAPIVRSTRQRTRFTVAASGRPAITHYDVDESFGRAALLSVRLETGRTHQVRVHLASVGHPVVGDAVYGAGTDVATELGLPRPALHARSLRFRHPVTGATVAVEEAPPTDLVAALARLRGQ